MNTADWPPPMNSGLARAPPPDQAAPIMDFSDLRKDYALAALAEKSLARDPFRQFEKWFQEAAAARLPEPNAMVCSLATRDGRPSSRMVLLKRLDARGFVFFTNRESRKGRELSGNPRVSLLFPWHAMERQIIIEGAAVQIPAEEAGAYFHSRPHASQISAWASPQSTVITGRPALEEAFKAVEKKYAGQTVPVPPHWSGWRVIPEEAEFWQGRRNRLHDRLRYRRDAAGEWMIERLAP